MPDESASKPEPGLPPKLNARKIVGVTPSKAPAEKPAPPPPIAGEKTDEVLPVGAAKVVSETTQVTPAETAKVVTETTQVVSEETAKVVAGGPPAEGESSTTVRVTLEPDTPVEKKGETSRLLLEDARPEAPAAAESKPAEPSTATRGQVKLKKPSELLSQAKGSGTKVIKTVAVKKKEAPPAPVAAKSDSRAEDEKGQTSRLLLEDARPGAPSEAPEEARTVRLKKPGELAAKGGQPGVVPAISSAPTIKAKPKAAKPDSRIRIARAMPAEPGEAKGAPAVKVAATPDRTDRIAVDETTKAGKPETAAAATGPATIRLKRPSTSAALQEAEKTSRLDVGEIETGAAARPAGQRTIAIKRKGAAPAGPEAAAGARPPAAKTIKVKRPSAAPAAAAEAAPATAPALPSKRRTIGLKRHEKMVSDRSARLAEQEQALKEARAPREVRMGAGIGWAWSLTAAATFVILMMTMYVFRVELGPQEENLSKCPGRILPHDHDFYKHNEREWWPPW
jgi:hypothetical protein